MATYRTILTNIGIALRADSEANGTPIVLTEMAVGDGNGNPVTPNPAQTFLARERYRADLNTLIVDPTNADRYIAELVVPATEGGFVIREVGLYTSDGDLFAVGNVPDTYKPEDTEGSFSDTIIRMIVQIGNASVVTLVIDPNVALATRTWVLNNVSAGALIPGGLTNQFLAKESNADGDFKWVDPTEGVVVIVFSREETQTLAAAQTVIDLADITAEGAAVYIEGVRLRGDQFSQTGPAQITLSASYPAGTKVTAVQNEEVGLTDMLLRPNNLSDVPDKAAARSNLGIPGYVSTAAINWTQLFNLPAYATRWPTWTEVTDKPSTFPPSAHTQDWGTITGVPVYTTRWPTWAEVTGKPSTFTPSAHAHIINDVTGLQAALDAKVNVVNPSMSGSSLINIGTLPTAPFSALFGAIQRVADGNVDEMQWLAARNSSGGSSWASVFWRLRRIVDVTEQSYIDFVDPDSNPGVLLRFGGNGHNASMYANGNWAFDGAVVAVGGYDYGSSRKLKDIDGPMPYGLAEVESIATMIGRYKPEYNSDGRLRLFFDAEQFAEVMPEVVDSEGVEFNGEKVPAIKLDQVMPPAYRAIAELAQLVRELRAEVEQLKAGR